MNRSMVAKNLKVKKCDIEMKKERQAIACIVEGMDSDGIDYTMGMKILSNYSVSSTPTGYKKYSGSSVNTDPIHGKRFRKGHWLPRY